MPFYRGYGRLTLWADGGSAAHQIEHDKAPVAHCIFDIVTEYPEIQHVPKQMHPAAMQEH